MKFLTLLLLTSAAMLLSGCKPDETVNPAGGGKMKFKLRFYSSQERLDNHGQPSSVPFGHAAQTPQMHKMSVSYIELMPNTSSTFGSGAVIFQSPRVTTGGPSAYDFKQLKVSPSDSFFIEIPFSAIPPGTYSYIRASVSYENFDIRFNLRNISIPPAAPFDLINQQATIGSFVGFNTYIDSFKIGKQYLSVRGNRAQGFWAFEPNITTPFVYNTISQGQTPLNGTTVPNPLFLTSPIPAGSSVLTGQLLSPLIITGQETQDMNVILSISINKSFEWIDNDSNGTFDLDYSTPANSDVIVDTGLRGLNIITY